MARNNSEPDDQAETRRTFTPGEKVLVHDARFPHSLRRATVLRANWGDGSELAETYTVESGMGGEMQAQTSQMHRLTDMPPVPGCSHCAADPNAASFRHG